MATFFLDFEGGNDANDGTTFANRWKTIQNGATAARIASGDTIRIKASRDPISLGSVTWTDGSATLTLPSALTQTIWNGDTAWTGASANVATSTTTSAPARKIGTTRGRLVPASAFTTGKMGYVTLPAPLDLSGYRQLSFWFFGRAAIPYTLNLCSDTTGDTVVNSVTFTPGATGTWYRVVIDTGAALGSAIASISLSAGVDPVTSEVSLQNLIACKGPDDAACLTHWSLVGKGSVGEPQYYPVLSIDGTTVVLGAGGNAGLSGNAMYFGTSESVASYAINPEATTGSLILQEGGASGTPITYSGGWDRTDMSTQVGETFVTCGDIHVGISLYTGGALAIENISVSHAGGAGLYTGSALPYSVGCTYTCKQIAGSRFMAVDVNTYSSVNRVMWSLDVDSFVHNDDSGTSESACSMYIDMAPNMTLDFNIERVLCIGNSGVVIDASARSLLALRVGSLTGASYGIVLNGSGIGGTVPLVIRDVTFSRIGLADWRCTGAGDVAVAVNVTPDKGVSSAAWASSQNSRLRFHNYNKTPGDHRIFLSTGHWITTETTIRHTESGVAWKMPSAYSGYAYQDNYLALARFAFAAGSEVTVSCWVYRNNTNLTAGIRIFGHWIGGVDGVLTDFATGAAETWEQLSVTFTPTEAGALELLAMTGPENVTWFAVFDDVTITQA